MSSEAAVSADAPSGARDLRVLGAEIGRLLGMYLDAARAGCDDDTAVDVLVDCERIASAVHAVQVHVMDGLVRGGDDLRACEFVPDEVAPVLGWSTDRAR